MANAANLSEDVEVNDIIPEIVFRRAPVEVELTPEEEANTKPSKIRGNWTVPHINPSIDHIPVNVKRRK